MKILAALGLLVACASAARAQTPSPASSPEAATFPGVRWDASVGFETLRLRDIARTKRPVGASPISWEGSGPSFRARIRWENARRLHQIDAGASLSGDFEYSGPVRSTRTWDGDSARCFDARYEYRRYPFRSLFFRGFDLGFGVEGLAVRASFTRRVPPDVLIDEARTNAGVGGSIAVRLRRWDRIGAEAAWINGLQIGRRHEEWTNGLSVSGSGGGWLSTLVLQADVRVSSRARVFANYAGAGEGFFTSHRSYALSRHRVSTGVTYGR